MALRLEAGESHQPFEVTAHLRTGIGWEGPYYLDLAGLLAGQIRRQQRAHQDQEGTLTSTPLPDTTDEDPEDLRLPLARCFAGADWHWAGTCARPDTGVDGQIDPRMFFRTTDWDWAARAADRPVPYASPKAGPYRDVMMTAPILECSAVTWRGIGDIDAVRTALAPVRFIGRRRATGEGRVLSWTITPATPQNPHRWVHAEGNTILRPCPAECALDLNIPYQVGAYAIRPPSWHPDRLMDLAMTAETDDDWFD